MIELVYAGEIDIITDLCDSSMQLLPLTITTIDCWDSLSGALDLGWSRTVYTSISKSYNSLSKSDGGRWERLSEGGTKSMFSSRSGVHSIRPV